jgi:hypothetical protein
LLVAKTIKAAHPKDGEFIYSPSTDTYQQSRSSMHLPHLPILAIPSHSPFPDTIPSLPSHAPDLVPNSPLAPLLLKSPSMLDTSSRRSDSRQ